MKRLTAALAAALLAPVLALGALPAVQNVAQASDQGTPHYPDLQTLPPSDVRIQRDRATRQKLLRFSNTVANHGAGPMELYGVVNSTTGQTDAFQAVYTHDAAGAWSVQSTNHVGTFSFAGHETHNHWHFDDFAVYQLRSVAPDGGIGATVYATSDKVSFCILDTISTDPTLEHAGPQTYRTCGQTSVQGITVGWADIYPSNLDGQSLDVTNVRNDTYWLVSTTDPENRLYETNNVNNAAAVKIAIKGNSVRVVP